MSLRRFMQIVSENAQIPELVYHGTTKDLWESAADGSLLFLAVDRSEAETYAEERASGEYMTKHPDRTEWEGFHDPSVVAVVVAFKMADLQARGFEFLPDFGWSDHNNPDATWQESLQAVGSFCISGFTEADKTLGKVTQL